MIQIITCRSVERRTSHGQSQSRIKVKTKNTLVSLKNYWFLSNKTLYDIIKSRKYKIEIEQFDSLFAKLQTKFPTRYPKLGEKV